MAPRNRLKLTALNRLSLVDNPANQHSHAVIAKRAAPSARRRLKAAFDGLLARLTPVAKDAQSYNAASASSQLWEKTSALSTSLSSILSDDASSEDKQKMIDETLSQFRDDLLALDADDAAFAALEAAGDDDAAVSKKKPVVPPTPAADKTKDDDAALGETDTTTPASTGISTMKSTPQTFTDLAAANAHVASLTKSLNDSTEEVEKLSAAADPLGSITKGLPAAAAEHVRKQHEELQTVKKTLADNARSARVTKMVAKSGADVSKLSLVVKSIDGEKLTDDERKAADEFLTDVFAKYSAQADELESLLKEENGLGIAPEGGDDVTAQVEKRASELMAANNKLSKAQAITKAYEEHPEWYEAADDEAAEAAVASRGAQ